MEVNLGSPSFLRKQRVCALQRNENLIIEATFFPIEKDTNFIITYNANKHGYLNLH